MNNIHRCIIADNNPKNIEIIYCENIRMSRVFWKLSSYLGSSIYDIITGGGYTSPKPSVGLAGSVTHQSIYIIEYLHVQMC